MIRRPPRSTQGVSSAASDVYKRQVSTQSTWGRPRYEIANFLNFFDQYYNSFHKNQISSPEESFADKLNRKVVTAIIVLGSVCVFVLLIGLIMLSKYYNYFCFQQKRISANS
eukprot:TRINITY_DN8023_c0_g1_i3.p2 TRINITY_DN8023_c0_g1~~TRINITY_DN8023_c0_g1_i3.p2  ORF type:complete len:112 (-),score=17.62 TRINITY_DN8023_c0_g1_i3:283-618(-)